MNDSIAQTNAPEQKLQVLYEDNHLIGVFKPPGLLVQGDGSGQESLLDQVRAYLKTTYAKPGNVFVGLIHRLDKPVQGVVLFAKTSKGASRLSKQFRDRTVRKTYHALVSGNPHSEGRVVHYLQESDGTSIAWETPKPLAKMAELEFRTLAKGASCSFLEIELKTGRKHQIRAQLAQMGHSIVGDKSYGSRVLFAPGAIALAAHSLEFDHPTQLDQRVRIVLAQDLLSEWKPWLSKS